jgi:hypothetical protein
MELDFQSINANSLGTEVLFLAPGSTGTAHLLINNNPNAAITTGQITGVTLGSGQAGDIIVTGAATATPSTTAGEGSVDFPYSVPAAAIPGFRNLSVTLNVNGNERLFLPGVVKVMGTGGLAVSTPASGNPPAGGLSYGATNAPLVRVHFQASAATATSNEDVRLRSLAFTIAGTGPMLPAVRLWVDRGTAGVVDAADTRVFTGTAYQNNPISETITATPSTTITFNDIVLTVPSGGTLDLLLTADVPASGTGDYVASFDPASLTAHGMSWGDNITPTGGVVSGGAQSLGTLSIAGLEQQRTTAGTLIPVGGTTNETQVTLMGIPTSSTGTCGMEVEVKPVGVAFDGTGTHVSATTFASGTTISIIVTGLTDLTGYHWRARATSPTLSPSPWVSFGSNPESAIDFGCDSSTTGPPSGLAQLAADGTPVPLGGSTHATIILEGTTGTNSGALPVALQIEVESAGTAFTNTPNLGSGLVAAGTLTSATFQGPTGDYHWQARTVDSVGGVSAWVAFNAAPLHFHLDAPVIISAKAGCAASIGEGRPLGEKDAEIFGVGLVLLILIVLPRRWLRRAGPGALLLLVLASPVLACQDARLPRSLMDASPAAGSLPSEEAVRPAEPFAGPPGSHGPFLVDAYLGALFQDMKFTATGTDFIERQVKGTGALAVGVEGFYAIVPDWRVGLLFEGDFWGNLEVLGGGVEGAWRFSSTRSVVAQGAPEMEHFLKLGLLYEDLKITKSNFGSFKSSFGIRAGYEFRYAMGGYWSLAIGAALQYAQWKYSPAVLSGDTKIGGIGGLLEAGISYQF